MGSGLRGLVRCSLAEEGGGCDAAGAASGQGARWSHPWGRGVTRSDSVSSPRQKGGVLGDAGATGDPDNRVGTRACGRDQARGVPCLGRPQAPTVIPKVSPFWFPAVPAGCRLDAWQG